MTAGRGRRRLTLAAPHHLEPGGGDGRLHRRLVHARRRVPQPLDQQRAVAGLQPVGGEHRVQDHAAPWPQHPGALPQRQPAVGQARQGVAAPHQVAGAVADRQGLEVALHQVDLSGQAGRGRVGQALGRPGRHQVDAEHAAAVAAGQRDRVGGIPAAGVQHQPTGVEAQPVGRVQQHLRRARPKAAAQQLIAAVRPAVAGEQLGDDPAGGWVGHAATLAERGVRVEEITRRPSRRKRGQLQTPLLGWRLRCGGIGGWR
jgi:hypothetical protein